MGPKQSLSEKRGATALFFTRGVTEGEVELCVKRTEGGVSSPPAQSPQKIG